MTTKSEYYTDVQVMGDYVYYRGVNGNKTVKNKLEYKPTVYLISREPTEWKTLDGKYVSPTVVGGMKETRDFLKKYESIDNYPIYGNSRFEYAFIAEYFKDDIHWDFDDLEIVTLDIEVESSQGFPNEEKAEQEILSIALHSSRNGYFVWGMKEYDTTKSDVPVTYYRCESEREMLTFFVAKWQQLSPNAITGWNVKFFDMPYLINRLKRLFGNDVANKLSFWNKLRESEKYFMGRARQTYELVGTPLLDYLQMYDKFMPGARESTKLDYILGLELGESKLDWSAHYKSLTELYDKDFQMFIDYNLQDVVGVMHLEGKLRLLETALTLAYDSKTNYDDVFTQTTMWDQIIHCNLLKKKIAIPPRKENTKSYKYEGAYVKEPPPGLYKWLVSIDLDSLYPHLIMQYNISPDMIVEFKEYDEAMNKLILSGVNVQKMLKEELDITKLLQDRKMTLTPNGQFFRVEKQGFLAEIMERMYEDRKTYKKKMIAAKKQYESETDTIKKKELGKLVSRYNNLQMAKKISLNSAYGALGNEYFRFYDVRQAEGVTLAGQLSIRWIENALNRYINKALGTSNVDYVIASDTDSAYLNLEAVVLAAFGPNGPKTTKDGIDFLDAFYEKKLHSFIEKSFNELAFYVNAYQQKMNMKRESLCDRGIWTSKKHYILNVWNNEGVAYDPPKLKLSGMEAVKSSTPGVCRKGQTAAIALIIKGDENALHEYVSQFKEEFMKMPVPAIAFPRGVGDMEKYADKNTIYGKGATAHIKGALLYNHKIDELQLYNTYTKIKNGDKLKFVYLKRNNPIGDEVIAFHDKLPEEFGLEKFVDRETQFEKSFIDPLKIVTNVIGWSVEPVSRLDI